MPLVPSRFLGVPSVELLAQARLRRELAGRLLQGLRGARSTTEAVASMLEHCPLLEQLGCHDEAARLRALGRAVEADLRLVELEAEDLELWAKQRGS